MKVDSRSAADRRIATERLRPDAVDLLRAFRAGGFPNHMAAVEQLSFLLLLRFLDQRGSFSLSDTSAVRELAASLSWNALLETPPRERASLLRDRVFPQLLRQPPIGGTAFAAAMRDALFAIPTVELLDLVVLRISAITTEPLVCADLLDVCLDEASITSQVASPRTPVEVTQCMLSLTNPRPTDAVLDPAAGSGQRLLALHLDPRLRGREAKAVGVELDATMVRLGSMSMLFHGIDEPDVQSRNLLATPSRDVGRFDVVLSQPPFGARVDRSMLSVEYRDSPNSRSELLYAEFVLNVLAEGGRAAIVLPASAAFSASAAHRRLRRRLVGSGLLRAVIALPAGTFQPHTNVETIIVAIGPTADRRVVFLDARPERDNKHADDHAQGAATLERAGEIVESLLGDAPQGCDVAALVQQQRALVVDEKTIVDEGDSLLASTYRAYSQPTTVVERPLELLGEIAQLEQEIAAQLSELRAGLIEGGSRDG